MASRYAALGWQPPGLLPLTSLSLSMSVHTDTSVIGSALERARAHTHTHTHTRTHARTHTHARMHAHTHTRMHARTHHSRLQASKRFVKEDQEEDFTQCMCVCVRACVRVRVCVFTTSFIPYRKFGLPNLGKATTAARATLPIPNSAWGIFVCLWRYSCQWSTSLTCAEMLTHAIAHGGCTNTVREPAL